MQNQTQVYDCNLFFPKLGRNYYIHLLMKVWLQMQKKMLNVVTVRVTDFGFKDEDNNSFPYWSDAGTMNVDEVLSKLLVLLDLLPLAQRYRAFSSSEVEEKLFEAKNLRQKWQKKKKKKRCLCPSKCYSAYFVLWIFALVHWWWEAASGVAQESA